MSAHAAHDQIEIWLVRHGESVSNAQGIWQGHGDSPLSERGRAQVEALGGRLGGVHFDLAITSDLSRAADTSTALGRNVERDRRWREIDVGDWEGLTMPEVVRRFPDQIEALKAREPFKVGGAESWPELFARADDALAAVRREMEPGQRAVVFSHGAVIAAIMAGLAEARERWPWPLGRMRNTAVSVVRFGPDGTQVTGHNDDSHLSEALAARGDLRADQSVIRLQGSDDASHTAADVFDAIERATLNATAPITVRSEVLVEVGHALLAGPRPNADLPLTIAPTRPRTELDILVSKGASILLRLGGVEQQ